MQAGKHRGSGHLPASRRHYRDGVIDPTRVAISDPITSKGPSSAEQRSNTAVAASVVTTSPISGCLKSSYASSAGRPFKAPAEMK